MDSTVDVWNDLKTRYSQGNFLDFLIYKWKLLPYVRETNLLPIILLNSILFGMKLRILDLTQPVLVRQIALVIVML